MSKPTTKITATFRLLSAVAIAAGLGLTVHVAQGKITVLQVLNVNTTVDLNGASSCNGGPCSLRQALAVANSNLGANDGYEVNLPAGHYSLTHGTLNVDNSSVTFDIVGAGPSSTIVDGRHSTRVLFHSFGSGPLTMSGVSVINGLATDALGGGGILNYSSLTLNNDRFMGDNSSNVDAGGGGIMTEYGSVTASNSTFSGNFAADLGGAIYMNGGSLAIDSSKFLNNKARSWGGAIDHDAGSLAISGTNFTGNVGGYGCQCAGGGAIDNDGGSLAITNSIFTRNRGGAWAGALYLGIPTAITNSTFSANFAPRVGAIEVSDTTLAITGSKIFANIAASDPALYVVDGPCSDLIMSNTTVSGNAPSNTNC